MAAVRFAGAGTFDHTLRLGLRPRVDGGQYNAGHLHYRRRNRKKCSFCGRPKTEVFDALGHAWDAGKVTTEPTQTDDSVKTYTYTRCGATKTGGIPADCGDAPFTDVAKGSWYCDAVAFAVQHGLFDGVTETAFVPNGSMTRAMLVTVLWRMDGIPESEAKNPFTDVPAGKYYTKAVIWAADNGIVNGMSEDKFNPNGNVTREQIAAILFRYADKEGVNTDARGNLSAFPDVAQVSNFAKDALSWANAAKLITGSEGKLLPRGNATRAQVATILMRYMQAIAQK